MDAVVSDKPKVELVKIPEGIYVLGLPLRIRLEFVLNEPTVPKENLIRCLAGEEWVAQLFKGSTLGASGYSLHEHSLMALRQGIKHVKSDDLPKCMSHGAFLLMLAVHDLGKGEVNSKGEQYTNNGSIFARLEPELPITITEKQIIKALISGDLLGTYMRETAEFEPGQQEARMLASLYCGGDLTLARLQARSATLRVKPNADLNILAAKYALQIKQLASQCGISPQEFLKVCVLYYQCDAGAYTWDAQRQPMLSAHIAHPLKELSRGYPALDFLFELNPSFDPSRQESLFIYETKAKRLQFSAEAGRAFGALERIVSTKADVN